MLVDRARILVDRDRIRLRVAELGASIAPDLSAVGDDEQVLFMPVMTGAMFFAADLIRHVHRKVRIGIVTASSYPGRATRSTGEPTISGLAEDLHGRHVVIIDDILDSGRTISRLRELVRERGAGSVRSCVLLRKPAAAAARTECEYVGFEIPDEFVVGYGLDYDGYYRNLPAVHAMTPVATS